MEKTDLQKNMTLSMEFNQYLTRNTGIRKKIPNKANLILTSTSNKALSERNRSLARSKKRVSFIEVQKTDHGWKVIGPIH